ncbi:AAA family ATPase [Streptomyces sp. NPDC052676]|uniref:AAA family ATPase n=1 Tax=Streptomyces sp. NPDC052676 TaxID=3154953 RepID=UPI003431CC07
MATATPLEVAVLVGLQASGKSAFYRQRLSGDHELVSKDLFPRGARRKQDRQMRLVAEALEAGRSVAVDNTNPSPEEWAPLVAAGHAHGARGTAYWFPPDLAGSLAGNAARQGRDRVPDTGIHATVRRLRRPSRADGFDAVREVRFDGRGGFVIRPAADRRGVPPGSAADERGPWISSGLDEHGPRTGLDSDERDPSRAT